MSLCQATYTNPSLLSMRLCPDSAHSARCPDEDEAALTLRAIVAVNECKFLAPDVPLFRAICADLFPGVDPNPPPHAALRAAVQRQCAAANLQPTPYFMTKACMHRLSSCPWRDELLSDSQLLGVPGAHQRDMRYCLICTSPHTLSKSMIRAVSIGVPRLRACLQDEHIFTNFLKFGTCMQVLQLYEMLAVRHGIMVIGLPLAGKSAVLQTLAAALSALAAAGKADELFERVDTAAINPKAVTMGELYGATDRATQEWRVRPFPSAVLSSYFV